MKKFNPEFFSKVFSGEKLSIPRDKDAESNFTGESPGLIAKTKNLKILIQINFAVYLAGIRNAGTHLRLPKAFKEPRIYSGYEMENFYTIIKGLIWMETDK